MVAGQARAHKGGEDEFHRGRCVRIYQYNAAVGSELLLTRAVVVPSGKKGENVGLRAGDGNAALSDRTGEGHSIQGRWARVYRGLSGPINFNVRSGGARCKGFREPHGSWEWGDVQAKISRKGISVTIG